MAQPPLPSRLGRYEITDRLGAGGMGVVYLATDPLLRRTVAIKVLPGGDDEVRERFGREARSAASLRHSNVVTIYDVGEYEDQPFIAMEFLDGESMHEIIQRKANVPIDKRLLWMIELCSGLGHAHRSGIVHRDIKPGNLMVTTEGTLKILDFGLARLTAGASQAGLTRVGAIMGTPHYMSPEQVNGETVDHRSDIFSVGLVLYELLSYSKAYSGDSAPIVLHNILHKSPAPIRSLLPEIDAELEGIVGRGIEKERDRRYQDLSSFAADLTRVRTRLMRSPDEATQHRSVAAARPEVLEPTVVRPGRNLDALAQRRAAQIAGYLEAATRQLEAGHFEAAIAECENALVLNPQDARALDMLDRAHHAIEGAQVERWLAEARALITGGELTAAEALIDQSLKLRADSNDAQALVRQLREKRRDRERNAERQRAAQSAIARARGHLSAGAFEAAARCASEALGYDSDNAEARALKEQAAAAIADRQPKEREQADRRAATVAIEESRTMMAAGNAQAALTLLKSFQPQELVAGALFELESRISQQSVAGTVRVEPDSQAKTPHFVPPVEWRMPVNALAAVAAALLIGVPAAWYLLGQSAPELQPTQPAAQTATIAPPAPDNSAALIAAREQYRNRDERGALATLAKIPDGNPDAEQLAATIRDGAAGRTVAARRTADAAKRTGVDAYRRALEKQNEAMAVGTAAADADRAVALFDQATTLYVTALKSEPPVTIVQQPDRNPVSIPGSQGGNAGGDQSLTVAQRSEVARLVEEGQRQLSDGEYEAAISAYEAALRIDPANGRATNGIAGIRKAQAAEAAALAGLKKKPGL